MRGSSNPYQSPAEDIPTVSSDGEPRRFAKGGSPFRIVAGCLWITATMLGMLGVVGILVGLIANWLAGRS